MTRRCRIRMTALLNTATVVDMLILLMIPRAIVDTATVTIRPLLSITYAHSGCFWRVPSHRRHACLFILFLPICWCCRACQYRCLYSGAPVRRCPAVRAMPMFTMLCDRFERRKYTDRGQRFAVTDFVTWRVLHSTRAYGLLTPAMTHSDAFLLMVFALSNVILTYCDKHLVPALPGDGDYWWRQPIFIDAAVLIRRRAPFSEGRFWRLTVVWVQYGTYSAHCHSTAYYDGTCRLAAFRVAAIFMLRWLSCDKPLFVPWLCRIPVVLTFCVIPMLIILVHRNHILLPSPPYSRHCSSRYAFQTNANACFALFDDDWLHILCLTPPLFCVPLMQRYCRDVPVILAWRTFTWRVRQNATPAARRCLLTVPVLPPFGLKRTDHFRNDDDYIDPYRRLLPILLTVTIDIRPVNVFRWQCVRGDGGVLPADCSGVPLYSADCYRHVSTRCLMTTPYHIHHPTFHVWPAACYCWLYCSSFDAIRCATQAIWRDCPYRANVACLTIVTCCILPRSQTWLPMLWHLRRWLLMLLRAVIVVNACCPPVTIPRCSSPFSVNPMLSCHSWPAVATTYPAATFLSIGVSSVRLMPTMPTCWPRCCGMTYWPVDVTCSLWLTCLTTRRDALVLHDLLPFRYPVQCHYSVCPVSVGHYVVFACFRTIHFCVTCAVPLLTLHCVIFLTMTVTCRIYRNT